MPKAQLTFHPSPDRPEERTALLAALHSAEIGSAVHTADQQLRTIERHHTGVPEGTINEIMRARQELGAILELLMYE